MKPVAGIAEALDGIALPVSIASNSPYSRIVEALRITGLTAFFGTRITTFEHVARAKPEPDIFIEAARRAGFKPAQCLVIEDSVTGVTAAAKAGCPVLGFTGTHHDQAAHGRRLRDAGAGIVFKDMAELPKLVSSFRNPR